MKNLLVKDWMTTDVTTIHPDTPLTEAAALMREKTIRRLPVVNQAIESWSASSPRPM